MTSQHHIIKRQVLELQIDSELKAFELQNKISDLYRRKIIPLIEFFCDQMSEADQLYRIDFLELDLGNIDPENIELNLIQKVKIALSQELSQQKKMLNAQVSKSIVNESFSSNSTNMAFGDRQQLTDTVNSQPINPVDANLELFHSFVETGTLPWWCEELDQAALEQCLKQLMVNAPNQLRKILQHNLKNTKIRQRIIWQFSETMQLDIVKLLAPNCYSLIQDYLEEILLLRSDIKLWKNITENKIKQKIFQGLLLQLALSSNLQPDSSTLLQSNLFYLADRLNIDWRSLVKELTVAIHNIKKINPSFISQLSPVLIPFSDQREPQLMMLDKQLKQNINNLIKLFDKFQNLTHISIFSKTVLPDIKVALKELHQSNTAFSIGQFKDISQIIELAETQISQLEKSQQASGFNQVFMEMQNIKQAIADHFLINQSQSFKLEATNNLPIPFRKNEEIYIQNAGLILLWPFLTRFFESLYLVQSGQFISLQATHRAILILQYLVDGFTESLESTLPLNKILCNVNLEDPVPSSLILSIDEKNECEELLGAVIQNWSALKKISINGLRQSFLQRNGILRFQNDHFLLQVEQKTHDILIQQIPWSINVIKLPFMSQILHIEWQ